MHARRVCLAIGLHGQKLFGRKGGNIKLALAHRPETERSDKRLSRVEERHFVAQGRHVELSRHVPACRDRRGFQQVEVLLLGIYDDEAGLVERLDLVSEMGVKAVLVVRVRAGGDVFFLKRDEIAMLLLQRASVGGVAVEDACSPEVREKHLGVALGQRMPSTGGLEGDRMEIDVACTVMDRTDQALRVGKVLHGNFGGGGSFWGIVLLNARRGSHWCFGRLKHQS